VKTALVTGASEGIGLELARAFAADGWDLAIVARGEERLRAAAAELQAFGHTVATFACDLAKDGAAQQLYDAVTRAGLRIDALVNNAGVATHGKFVDISTGDELAAIHLNVIALTHLLKLFVPPMVARGSGYVLNVASTAGLQPGPTMAAYYATKAYVLSLSEALSEELRGTGVRVVSRGRNMYCIAWPSPNKYATQLKYSPSRGLVCVFVHSNCMMVSRTCESRGLKK